MKLVRPDQLMISSLLADSEDWMLERLFLYASRQSYTKYSSTLKEAWRLSIMGLNRAITSAAETEADWELTPDADYQRDPACAFGILEAQKHRARGVNLAMFLGLFKYYRQTYQDLLREKGEFEAPRAAAILVDRIFDRIEIAFCTEWAGTDGETQILDLADANRNLANQKNLFLTFFESLHHPAFLFDKAGSIRHMNAAAHGLLGRSEVPGAHYYAETRVQERLPFLEQEMMDFLGSGAPQLITEHNWCSQDRSTCFEVHFHRLQDISGKLNGAALTLVDITDRLNDQERLGRTNTELESTLKELRKTQQQFVQSAKMAAIGQLAAGVAHEINNPVGFVSTNLNQLKENIRNLFSMLEAYRDAQAEIGNPATRAELAELAEQVELDWLVEDTPELMAQTGEGLDRVIKIVQDLKNFSRKSSDRWEEADLNGLIESTLNVVWNQVKYNAEVVKEFGDLPGIECHPNQLAQVIMNLVVNAAQAIEGRGTITLTTGCLGDRVFLEVRDTGAGIPEEIRGEIFNPFFTTKPVGQGTGLGLPVSHEIVLKHGGQLDLETVPGQGTTFRVTLPVAQPVPADSADLIAEPS
jgi:signal transduction histidine kinase